MNFTILTFDTVDSTNAEAMRHAKLGAEEGLCVIAVQQTAGRGRHGRKWVSEKDAGLYFSIVLRPRNEPRFLPLITFMTGVAVHDTLAEFGLNPDIKWVNDILVNEKKICGILAETTEGQTGAAVVVGIGINLKSSNFPAEIAEFATSLEAETGRIVIAAELAERLTPFLRSFYDVLCGENGYLAIIEEWRRRSSYFSGKNVRVVLDNETIIGTTEGLENDGALRLRAADGSLRIIRSGNVQNLRAFK